MAATNTLVLYPFSGRGHIVSMLEFANLIHNHLPQYFSITAILSTHNTADNFPAAYPSINFHYLQIPSPEPATTEDYSPVNRLNNPSLHSTLTALSRETNLKAFIIDFLNAPASQVAAAFHIPTYYYFTSGGHGLAQFLYFPTLVNNILPRSFKDLGRQTVNIPGVLPFPASEVMVGRNDRTTKFYQDCLEIAACMAKSSGIIINTFDCFDSWVLRAIRDGLCIPDGPTPPLFTVGPIVETKVHSGADRHESLQWLDSQPTRSVVFLCFGSMGAFSRAQMKEMATGLERSGVRFLWVVRGPLASDEAASLPPVLVDENATLDSILPEGFLERTRDHGLVVKSWAPQVDVLRHGSVGGFMTHCGWNSILEAVSAGVPMVAWPLYVEQPLNRDFLVEEAKIAVRVVESDQGFVTADELERRLNQLMSSEIGVELTNNVAAMRDAMVAAKAAGGTSTKNLAKLADIFNQN